MCAFAQHEFRPLLSRLSDLPDQRHLFHGIRKVARWLAALFDAVKEMAGLMPESEPVLRLIAECLAKVPGIGLNASAVSTNIVIFDISALGVSTTQLSNELKSRRVLANGVTATQMRLVTHRDVSREQCEHAASILASVAAQKREVSAAV